MQPFRESVMLLSRYSISRPVAVRYLIAAMVFLAQSSPASTIVCLDSRLSDDQWVSKHFETSEIVVLAEVTDSRPIPRPDPPATNTAGSMRELLELIEKGQEHPHFSHEAVLLTDEVWKGPVGPRLKVVYSYSPGQYGFMLPVGGRFLIFGGELPDGRYTISTICKMTVPESEAGAKIRALNKLISGSPDNQNDQS